MAIVYLPSSWATSTDGLTEIVIDAPRVHELRQALTERFPAIAELLSTVSVAVDGRIYHDAEFVALNRDSEIHLVPPVSGGACLPSGFAPRTPPYALSRAAAPGRSVRVARSRARSRRGEVSS
jgi:molybdopterin converting factor small subunit